MQTREARAFDGLHIHQSDNGIVGYVGVNSTVIVSEGRLGVGQVLLIADGLDCTVGCAGRRPHREPIMNAWSILCAESTVGAGEQDSRWLEADCFDYVVAICAGR